MVAWASIWGAMDAVAAGFWLSFPILDMDRGDTLKFADITRDKREPPRNRLTNDQYIIRSDRCAGSGQHRAQFAGLAGIFPLEIQDGELQRLDASEVFGGPSPLIGAEEQFVRHDGRNGKILWLVLAKAGQEAGMTFQDGDDSVAIEQILHLK